ncbi:hypothetical protein K491DRAFT_273911 [Lophiostoma macrostomum CBS 122681]|uniref:Uncharacterized protein n=1 Tax=Lophiostoma macrostomum CBS 122681 TaxID=1314788 RepID=A0A6A6TET7_9PLEO|nr:hypothetical protein K491DRAFT_273911 [Lophiostoma macrostomum CBS 122681]
MQVSSRYPGSSNCGMWYETVQKLCVSRKVSAAQSERSEILFRLAKIVAAESAVLIEVELQQCNSARRVGGYWCLRTRRLRRLCEEVTQVAPVNKERAVYKGRPTGSAKESAAVRKMNRSRPPLCSAVNGHAFPNRGVQVKKKRDAVAARPLSGDAET